MSPNSFPIPWYRHRWPWFLMLAPATALVVGFYSLWLSIRTADALVAEDYYKEGTAINQDLHRDGVARSLGLSGHLALQEGNRVHLTLLARGTFMPPPAATLKFIHATRAGLDQTLTLKRDTGEDFSAMLAPLAAGRWNVLLLDSEENWRLAGSWQSPGQTTLQLMPLGQ